jgi:hypothetical protein
MDWLKKNVNIKTYLLLTLVTIIIVEAFFAKSQNELWVFAFISLASVLNQLMLVVGLGILFKFRDTKPGLAEMTKVFFLMLTKTGILAVAFYMGILLIKDRIIIALFIYIVQLANLFFSIKKKQS